MADSEGQTTLEGYVELAKDAKGANAVSLIKTVLKNAQIYVFGELLTTQNVLDLEKNAEHKPWLDVLRIFAYGTFKDYQNKCKEHKDFPKLSAGEIEKLKQLTIVTHASQSKALDYSELLAALEIKDVRELEDVIIDTVYAGLIKGKLDQKKQVFEVEYAMGRDIGPEDVKDMLDTISSWLATSKDIIDQLEKRMQSATGAIERRKAEEEKNEKIKKDKIEAIKLQRDQQPDPASLAAMMNFDGGRRVGPGPGKRARGRQGSGGGFPGMMGVPGMMMGGPWGGGRN